MAQAVGVYGTGVAHVARVLRPWQPRSRPAAGRLHELAARLGAVVVYVHWLGAAGNGG